MMRLDMECQEPFFTVSFSVAFGEIFGGFLVCGPPESITRMPEVYRALVAEFPALSQASRIIWVTPGGHPDIGPWLVQRLEVNGGLELFTERWLDQNEDVIRAIDEAEETLHGLPVGNR